MINVKTFTNALNAMHAMKELSDLDAQINAFIEQNGVKKVICVSDTTTCANGDTIGIIRVLTYETE